MANDRVIVKIDGDDSGFEKSLSGIGNTSKKVLGAAVKGIAATSAAIGTLAVTAVKGYADCEQLVGGIETLFGAKGAKSVEEYAQSVGKAVSEVQGEYTALIESQEKVLENANNAYKTSGLSANKYMETVASFAASLKQSFADTPEGIAAAGEAADKAIIDMADNSNKMGTAMESIQMAYQGFAKQNYTMLDNLKLGYGGTKTEMERLLADAQKLSGVKYDISNLADVYEAIHVIQTEIGITGTTTKEATETITGSVNMMKAAWSNLMVGIADDNADLDMLITNFVDSLMVVGDNIIPVLERALGGIGEFISQAADKIVPKVVDVIIGALPELSVAAVEIIAAIATAIIDNIPLIIDAAEQILIAIADAFEETNPVLKPIADMLRELALHLESIIPVIAGAAVAYGTYKTVVAGTTAVQLALNAAMMANPIGLVITLLGAAIGMLHGYATATYDALEGTDEFCVKTRELKEESEELIEAHRKASEQIKETAASTETEMKAAAGLIPELEALSNTTNRTEEQNARLNSIVNQMNSAFPDLALAIDDETGALNMQISTLKKATEAWINLAKAKAMEELLVENEKTKYKLEKTYEDQYKQFEIADDKFVSVYNDDTASLNAVEEARESRRATAEAANNTAKELDKINQENLELVSAIADLNNSQSVIDELGLGGSGKTGSGGTRTTVSDGGSGASGKSSEDRITDSLDAIIDRCVSAQDEAELLYDIWEETYGEGASLQEKTAKKTELLSTKINAQEKIVEETKKAYQQAKNELGETSETTLELKNSVLEATKELTGMKKELEEVSDTLALTRQETESNIELIEAKYELWCSATKNTATEEEKAAKKTEYLNAKIEQQGRYVAELEKRYNETVAKYGETAEASIELEKQLYKEKDAWVDLNNELAEHNQLEQHEIADAAKAFNDFLRDYAEKLMSENGLTYEAVVDVAARVSGYDKVLKQAENISNNINEIVNENPEATNEAAEVMQEEAKKAGESAAESFVKNFVAEMGEVPDGFFDYGEKSAESFEKGFIKNLHKIMDEIKTRIQEEIDVIISSAAKKEANNIINTTNVTNNSTYVVQPSSGESTQQQLQAVSAYQKKNEILRN